jgi:peptidoglycan hydrolase-like protein with peptidoglycan-binding domain
MSMEYKLKEASHCPAAGRALGYRAQGTASWYGPGFHGRRTANGEIYDQKELTAAHKTLPLDTWVRVSAGGRCIVVRINDRGPYVGDRLIDLSFAAAQRLGVAHAGTATVEIEAVAPPGDPLGEGHRPVLLKGSFGDPVLWLTRELSGLGLIRYDPNDDVFGSVVDGVVRNYQKGKKLFNDGIVGRGTWRKLLT